MKYPCALAAAKQYSQGSIYVLVNGRFVVKQGALLRNVYPGQAIYTAGIHAEWRSPASNDSSK